MITAITMGQRDATLPVRERLTIGPGERPGLLAAVRQETGGGAALLATCNRLELYATGPSDPRRLIGLLSRAAGADPAVARRVYRVRPGPEAIEHFFRVAAGLESLVLGESEILGQVRAAYAAAVAAGSSDPVISHLFHSALRTGRRARAETAIGAHSLSVSAIAARLARERLGDLGQRTGLVIGTGEAGRLAAGALRDLGLGRLLVANRSPGPAAVLAESLGARAIALDALAPSLACADVVVTSTGAGRYLLDRPAIAGALRVREGLPMLLIDLSLPRDIDPSAANLDGVTLVDLDGLEDVQAANAALRSREVGAVERLIRAQLAEFTAWLEGRTAVPRIRALTTWADGVRRRQVDRAFRGSALSEAERERLLPVLDRFSRSLTRQLLHPSIAAERGGAPEEVPTLRPASLPRRGGRGLRP